jgi:GH18 family chitinase
LLARSEIQIQRDKRWRVPWFQYREEETSRTVWFDDNSSLNEKLELIVEYRLRGFAPWRLGNESPDFWGLVAEIEKAHAAATAKTRQKQKTVSRSTRKRTAADRPSSRAK